MALSESQFSHWKTDVIMPTSTESEGSVGTEPQFGNREVGEETELTAMDFYRPPPGPPLPPSFPALIFLHSIYHLLTGFIIY